MLSSIFVHCRQLSCTLVNLRSKSHVLSSTFKHCRQLPCNMMCYCQSSFGCRQISCALANLRTLSPTPLFFRQPSNTVVNFHVLSSIFEHCRRKHSCALVNLRTLSSALIISSIFVHCRNSRSYSLSSTLEHCCQFPYTPTLPFLRFPNNFHALLTTPMRSH